MGEKLTSQIFPRGKKLTGQFFPRGKKLTGEKTDRYTGSRGSCLNMRPIGRVFKHRLRDLTSVNAMKQTCVIVIIAYFK